jgi:ribosomal protein S18 acetylase RimI-like enzyme
VFPGPVLVADEGRSSRRADSHAGRWDTADMPAGPPDGTAVAAVMVASTLALARAAERGWVRRIGGVLAMVTEIPEPTLNGVWAPGDEATAHDMTAGLEAVAAEGVPHCLEVRPACAAVAAGVAGQRGLVTAPVTPLMALAGPVGVRHPDGLTVRVLRPDEARVHCEIAAAAFEAPLDLFTALATPSVLALPEVRCYAGEVAGVPVASAMAVTCGDGVGISTVGTLPAHRRRGHASAVVARAIADGLAAGASWAWLQADETALGMYERLGFRTVERWPCWVTSGDGAVSPPAGTRA